MLNGQQLISNWLLAVAVQSFLLYQTIALNCVGSSDWPKNSTTFLVNWNYPQNTWAIFLNGEGFDHINTTVLKRLTHVTLYFFFFFKCRVPLVVSSMATDWYAICYGLQGGIASHYA